MKVPMKKPAGSVAEMVTVPGTYRMHPVLALNGDIVRVKETRTLAYPDGHPRQRYKKLKKALKRS